MVQSSTLADLLARFPSSLDALPAESRPFFEDAVVVPPEIWSSRRFLALFVS